MEKIAYTLKFNSSFVRRTVVFTAFFAMTIFNCYAQKLTQGSLSFLKGQDTVHIVLDFDGVTIKGQSEAEYIALEGSRWAEEWEEAKTSDFPNLLIEKLNDNVRGVRFGKNPQASYQATVHVRALKRGGPGPTPGKTIDGPGRFSVDCEVVFTKTGDSTPLAIISGLNAKSPGLVVPPGFTFKAMAFGGIGQSLGKFITKKI